MTDTEQRIAIAKACGWKRYSPGDFNPTERWEYGPIMGKVVQTSHLPDYHHDLNAMHVVWSSYFTDGNERVRFSCELLQVVARAWRLDADDARLSLEGIVENATARQRAEAFLRTLGLWKD